MPGLPSPRPDIRPHPRASWHHHASTGSCAQLCGYKTVVVTKHLRADPLAQSGLRTEVFSVCAAQPHSMCEKEHRAATKAIAQKKGGHFPRIIRAAPLRLVQIATARALSLAAAGVRRSVGSGRSRPKAILGLLPPSP